MITHDNVCGHRGNSVPEYDKLFDNRIWEEWFSTSEAAKFLSTTPNAIRIMVCRGKLKASRLGRRKREA